MSTRFHFASVLVAGLLLTGCSLQTPWIGTTSGQPVAGAKLSSMGPAEATFICQPLTDGGGAHAWQYRGSSVFLIDGQGRRLGHVQLQPVSARPAEASAAVQPDHRLVDTALKGSPAAQGFTHALRQAVEGLVPPRLACNSHNAGGVEIRPYRAQFLLVRGA